MRGVRRLWSRFAAVAVCAALVAIGVLIGSTTAHGQRLRTLTLRELDRGSTFTHIRNTKSTSPRANSQGDVMAFTNPVADTSGKIVGKFQAACTTTTGARNFVHSTITCLGVIVLRDGSLTGQFAVNPGANTSTGTITGGTGAYANARGVIVSKHAEGGSLDTITLVA